MRLLFFWLNSTVHSRLLLISCINFTCRKELKRLNVTVIDTANEMVKSKKPDEICQKAFCKLGCVCDSIDVAKHIQTHCRLYDCMFSCNCINVSQIFIEIPNKLSNY